MNSLRDVIRCAVVGGVSAAALGVIASPAAADMLAYTAGKDVWVENADGSQRKQLTTDGRGGTYVTPSPNDAGDVAAIQLAGFSAGIHFFPADGSTKKVNMMPTRNGGALVGPFSARLVPESPSKLLAYTYAQSDLGTGTQGPYLNVVRADAPGSSTADGGVVSPFVATPHADKFVYTALDGKLYYGLGGNEDPVMLSLKDSGIDIKHGEVSRDGSTLLVIASSGGPAGALALARLNGPMPGTVGEDCIVATTGGAKRAALSPGGDRVAWADDAGLHVASVGFATQNCTVSDQRTLSANGDYPAFSRHTLGGATGSPDSTTTDTPATAPPAPAPAPKPVTPAPKRGGTETARGALTVKATTSSLRAALKRGLTLRFTGLKAGKTTVRIQNGRTVLSRRSVTASKSGEARLIVRFSPKQRASLRRKRRVTLTLTVGTTTTKLTLR